MAILRNSFVGLSRTTPASEDMDSGPLRLRPADGDATEDFGQTVFGFIYCEQHGAGSVQLQVLGSFGDGVWMVIGQRTLTEEGAYLLEVDKAPFFMPVVRARVTSTPPEGSDVKPPFAAVMRIASNAPFRVNRVDAPVIVERYPTQLSIEEWNDNGGGGDPGGSP